MDYDVMQGLKDAFSTLIIIYTEMNGLFRCFTRLLEVE